MRGTIARKNGRYYASIEAGRDPETKKRRRQAIPGSFTTKKAAQIKLTEVLTDVQRGTYVAASKLTVEEYLDAWLKAQCAGLRPSTWTSYNMNLRTHVIPTLGQRQLQHLAATELDRLYANLLSAGGKRRQGPLSPRTVRYVHTIFRRALNDAVRKNLLARNIADQADPPRTRSRHEIKTWTAAELRTFLEGVRNERFYAAWLLAATTGMRRGEVLGLRWRDVDIEMGRLAIRQTVVNIDYEIRVSTPKTDRGYRSVALDPATIAVLMEHRRRQLQERLALGSAYQDQDLVFAREDGSPVHPDRFSDTFEQRVRVSGLPRIRLHDVRHTHATIALSAGVHPKVVSERLGHASISITLDIYSHAVPAMDAEAANRIAGLIFGQGA